MSLMFNVRQAVRGDTVVCVRSFSLRHRMAILSQSHPEHAQQCSLHSFRRDGSFWLQLFVLVPALMHGVRCNHCA